MSTLSYRPTSNGTGGNISFTIDSFSESEIEVYVDGVKRTNGGSNNFDYDINPYSATGGTIVWNTSGSNAAPTSGNTVRIQRRTKVLNNAGNAVEGKATYSAGAAVKATDLNNNTKQALRAIQEKQDQLVQTYDIQADAINGTKIADDAVAREHIANDAVNSEHYADLSINAAHLNTNSVTESKIEALSVTNGKIANSAVTSTKIADNAITSTEILNGAVTREKLAADIISGAELADNALNSEHYTDGSIDRVHLEADIIDSTKLADNAVNSEHYVDGSIDRVHLSADIIDSTKIENGAVGHEHLQADAVRTAKIQDNAVTIDKIADGNIVTQSEQASHTVNDNTFFTTAAAEARFFNVSSGETIKDGDTFPDNDNTIATTAAINDRIIDLIDDVGGFTIIASEQAFPDVNPQGVTGQAAVLSIKAATTNLVPSGTTVTVVNGNVANNANITITGVPSTIPSGFGFLVESTTTLHTYSFHRLVPNATEVTAVADKAVEIGRLGTADAVADMAILGTADVVADLNTLGTADVVADMNTLATSDVVSDMNTLAVADVLSDMSTVADNVTNVNNVGNNITNVNSVSNSAGANQTFTVTAIIQSGSVRFHIDGVRLAVLKLARGKTYIFDQSDSSNSGHPLRFRDSSNNVYTSGVTASGTAGSSGATVTFAVPSNAPSTLKYYCTSHGNVMGNTINVIDDNVGAVAGALTNVNIVGGAITNVNNVGNNISNVNTVANNLSSVNSFFNTYRIGANNPTTSLDTGDLFFNTTSNSLKVYTGSAWVDGVTTTGNFALKTGNTFTGSNRYNDNVKAEFGTSADLEIYHDGSNSYIADTGTGALFIQGDTAVILEAPNGENYFKGTKDAASFLYYDGVVKLSTTTTGITVTDKTQIDGSSGSTELILKRTNTAGANGNAFGSIKFNDSSNNTIGRISTIRSTATDDGDIRFEAKPTGGSLTEYLRIKSTGNVQLPVDNTSISFGASADLSMKHDGTNSYILNNTGSFILSADTLKFNNRANNETKAQFINNGAAELYYDGSKKFETTSSGAAVTGSLGVGTTSPDFPFESEYTSANSGTFSTSLAMGSGTNANLYAAHLQNTGSGNSEVGLLFSTGNTQFGQWSINCVKTGAFVGDLAFRTRTGGTTSIERFKLKSSGNVQILQDNAKLQLGASQDLQLYHDGSHSRLNSATGMFNIQSDDFRVTDAANSLTAFKIDPDGATDLRHNGTVRLQTTSGGVSVTGQVISTVNFRGGDNVSLSLGDAQDLEIDHDGTNNDIHYTTGNLLIRQGSHSSSQCLQFDGNGHLFVPDNEKVYFGASADLQIYHDGSNSYIKEAGTGNLNIQSDNTTEIEKADGTDIARFHPDGAVELFHDGTKKFDTTANGINVVGRIECDRADIDGQINLQYGSGTNTNYMAAFLNNNGIMHIFRGDALYIGNNMSSSNQGSGPNNAAIKLATNGNVTATAYYGDGSNLTGITSTTINNNAANTLITGSGTANTLSANSKFKVSGGYIHLNDDNGGISFGTAGVGSFGTTPTIARAQQAGYHITTSGSGDLCLGAEFQNDILFGTTSSSSGGLTGRLKITAAGHTTPASNNAHDLGTSSVRWRNIYTNDLNLSNEGSSNDVDGTWGNYTIQEGESDLFLKNNRTGKKYKFNLTEVA